MSCLVLGLASASDAEKRGREPKVVCVTSYQPPRGIYAYTPGTCDFHKRGEFPIAHANTAVTFNLDWKAWGNRRARGEGKIGISTVGPVPVKIKLTKPRDRCGRVVFTKAHFSYDGESFDGTPVHGSFDMPLENCLT